MEVMMAKKSDSKTTIKIIALKTMSSGNPINVFLKPLAMGEEREVLIDENNKIELDVLVQHGYIKVL